MGLLSTLITLVYANERQCKTNTKMNTSRR